MLSKIPRKFQNLFLAIIFIVFAIFSYFWQNHIQDNFSHSEQKISQKNEVS